MTLPRLIAVLVLAVAVTGCGGSQDMSKMTIRAQKADDKATRSVHGRIRNNTTDALYLHNVNLITGAMKNPPPATIDAGATGEFLAESAPGMGLEGTIDYRVGSAGGPRTTFYFNNPYRGDSTVGVAAPAGHTATHEWHGDENARVTYTLRSNKVE